MKTRFSTLTDQFMVGVREGLAEGAFEHLRRTIPQPDPALAADRERLYDGRH